MGVRRKYGRVYTSVDLSLHLAVWQDLTIVGRVVVRQDKELNGSPFM